MSKSAHSTETSKALADAHRWKQLARWHPSGYFNLKTEDTGDVPVRLFLTHSLLESAEDILYRQIVNATRFPGVKMVVITPDVHYGYGVPVGCVLITDYESGAIAMGPVGYDIGCGMMSAKSNVPVDAATPEKRLQFNAAVMERIEMGAGGKSHYELDHGDDRLAFADDRTYGALRLELTPTAARYAFVSAAGRVLDSGSVSCRR